MSYSQIRNYFNQKIQSYNSDFKEWRGALVYDDAQNIPSTTLNTYYHVELNSMSSTGAQDVLVQDAWTVNLTILKFGARDPLSALDEILDSAFCIKTEIIDPRNVEQFKASNDGDIEAIELASITPSAIDASNDNSIKVQLQFNVRMYYSNLTV